MIKKCLYCLTILLLLTSPANAAIEMRQTNGVIYVKKATVKELETLFEQYHYRRFRGLDNNAYPAIFVQTLPSDYTQIESQKYRNELFIRILAPLALKINEELYNERQTLLRLEKRYKENQEFTPEQITKLEELAQKYDYFTRQKDNTKIGLQIENLKLRINMIPPSILIAAAAMESNWGFSRVSQQANSLYKEKIWYTDEGLEPLENKEDGYRFKIFNSLIDSMRSFALTFNSDIKFFNIWDARAQIANRQEHMMGETIAYALANCSTLPNFAGILDYTTAFYDLVAIDMGHLNRLDNSNNQPLTTE